MKRRMSWVNGVSVLGLGLALAACQGNDRLVEKASIEGTATARTQIEAENENLRRRSREMEDDLARRQRFYQAVAGTYEGALETDQGTFSMRIVLVPSLPPYRSERVRLPEEIASDLNNLYLNAQIVQWNPANPLSATGCRVEAIRPDLGRGEIQIATNNCPNLYSVYLSADVAIRAGRSGPDLGRTRELSSELARNLLEGRSVSVSQLLGQVKPTTNPAVYRFALGRVEE